VTLYPEAKRRAPVLPHVILLPDASWRMLPAAKRTCEAFSLLLHSRAFDFHTTAIAALRPHRRAPLSFLTSSRLRHFLSDRACTFEDIFTVRASPVTIQVRQLIRPVTILMRQCGGGVRWLTKEEVSRRLQALPPHQRQLARFALATGLRQANVLGMRWSAVDLERRTAWVHADEAKGGIAIGVPLNDAAIAVLREEIGKHDDYVFTFRRRPLAQANTKAWQNALRRAGIEHFRWHDLRHYGRRGTSRPAQR
jgi:integrase